MACGASVGPGRLRRGPDPADAGGGADALPQLSEDRLPGPAGLAKKYWPAVERLTCLRHQVRAGRAAAGPAL